MFFYYFIDRGSETKLQVIPWKHPTTQHILMIKNNSVKLGHSGAFQKVKFQNFLQPW